MIFLIAKNLKLFSAYFLIFMLMTLGDLILSS